MRSAVLVVIAIATRAAFAQPQEGSGAPQNPGEQGSGAPTDPTQPTEPGKPSPDQLEFERAKTLYAAGNFAAAADAFHKAYDQAAKSEYMFGWAQALRKAGDCTAALELYNKLLAMQLDETEAAATRQAMALCEAKKPPPPPPPVVEDRPWYSDWKANLLVGVGVLAIGGGGYMTVQSISDERAARRATTYGEFERLTDRATIFRFVGIGAIAIGGASAAFAGYRYATRARNRTLSAWASGTGGGIAIGGTW